jgi:streptogramin lyase
MGSVIKIGVVVGGTRCNADSTENVSGDYLKPPFDYNTCVDRDMDGLIKTSRGLGDIRSWLNTGGADDNGGVSTADDEAILMYVRVNGDNVRHVSVDTSNNVWVGGYSDNTFDLLDGDDGTILATFDVGLGGYGGLVDGNDVIWAASRNPVGLLRYDTKGTITTADDTWAALEPLVAPNSYGLGIDTNGNVWHAQWSSNVIYKYHPDGTVFAGFPKTTGGASNDRGVAVTPSDNHVWVANSGGSDVSRLDNNGNVVKVIPVGVTPTGVAVDAEGKVWVTNLTSDNVMRIDPGAGADGLGEVDLTVGLGAGAYPYNYSDMTGIVAIQAARQGTWTVVYDSTEAGTDWGTISWTCDEPPGTSVMVEARAADTVGGLAGETFVAVSNDVKFSGMAGQYIEIQTTLSRGVGVDATPILYDLTVEPANHPPTADAGPDETLEQTCYAGANVTLDGSGSSDPDGDVLIYVWTWDGESAMGVSPTIVFPLGTTTVTLEVDDGEYTDTDTVDITVEDTTPPEISCVESVNPHGNNIPGGNRPDNAKGKNPDGFYEICAIDICDSAPDIYIGTEEFVVGQSDPYQFFIFEGCVVVKFTEAPGASPFCKSMGGSNACQATAVSYHIKLPSDPVITAIDASGNSVVCTGCLVPPPPK